MTSVIMGPFATQILAALGADVIKVELPEGDNMRHVGPMRNPGMGPISAGQPGQALRGAGFKQAAARQALLQLLAEADVFISNVRPQAMARLGLDWQTLEQSHPRLIHVSWREGFDQAGPYAASLRRPDPGATGVPWLAQQYGGGEPSYAPMTLGDRVTGLHAVYAVTAALYAREKSGLGQAVVVPMFEAMTQFILAINTWPG